MYVLTIVFVVSQVTIQSVHASADVCEALAARVRSYVEGPQAVASARCEFTPGARASSGGPDPAWPDRRHAATMRHPHVVPEGSA